MSDSTMFATSVRRPLLAGMFALCVCTLGGCSHFKQQVQQSLDNNPQMRQNAIDASRKSCVQTAMSKAPKLPGIDVKINKYCDCFATKGMSKISNSELASIGLHGGKMTPEEQAKVMEGVQLCQSELTGGAQ